MALLASLDRGQTLDRPLVQGAGRQAIDGLRGKGDDLAFDQGLNRLVNHVAQIICVPEINHDGWHSQLPEKPCIRDSCRRVTIPPINTLTRSLQMRRYYTPKDRAGRQRHAE